VTDDFHEIHACLTLCFVNSSCTEFHENLQNGLVADSRKETDGRNPHIGFSLFLLLKEA
jgi:hypothetical protein